MVDEYMLNRSLPRAPLLVAVKMLRPNADDRARSVNSIILFILSKYDRVVKCTLVLFYKVGEQYHYILSIWSRYDRIVKYTLWCYFTRSVNNSQLYILYRQSMTGLWSVLWCYFTRSVNNIIMYFLYGQSMIEMWSVLCGVILQVSLIATQLIIIFLSLRCGVAGLFFGIL